MAAPTNTATAGLRWQFGQETTWGTGVAASAKIMGVQPGGSMTPTHTPLVIPETGRFGPSAGAVLQSVSGAAKMSQYLSYEDILYLTTGAFGVVSPTDANPLYTWTYAAPYDAALTLKPFTIEYGLPGSAQGYEMAGSLLNKLTLKADKGGVWMADSEWIGETVASSTITTLSDRTVEYIRASDTTFAIDAWGGTMGSTGVTTTLLNWELSIDLGRNLRFHQGVLAPDDYSQGPWKPKLTTVLDFTSTTKTVMDDILTTLSQRQIAIAGASSTHSVTIRFAGQISNNVTLWEDDNGARIIKLEWEPVYNATYSGYLGMVVANAVSALT